MSWNKPPAVSRAKELGALEALRRDPNLGRFERNVYPLSGRLNLASAARRSTRTLGQGTFGRVNLEELTEGDVATKYFTGQPDYVLEDIIGELAAMKYTTGLPNITPLVGLSFSNAAGTPLNYPAMALGKGVSTLRDARFSSWDALLSACLQVLRGYYTLHSMKLVHRDTKPDNMLLTSYGEVWVSDLGKARYLDTQLPFPEDNYCGTYWYASPEGLMKFSGHQRRPPLNSFENDCWAVGASLYRILTGKEFQQGNTEPDCVEAMILRKGTPTAADGEVFTLFDSWPQKAAIEASILTKTGNAIVAQHPAAITQRVIDGIEGKVPGVDIKIREQVATVIAGLMEYNPTKRLTIAQALSQMPGVTSLPPALAPPSLTTLQTELSVLPNDITPEDIDTILNWLCEIVNKYCSHTAAIPFVLDRVAFYVYTFLQKYTSNSFCTKQNLQVIGVTAAMIAFMLFEGSAVFLPMAYFTSFFMSSPNRKANRQSLLACLRMYLEADIPFYGRTLMDELSQGADQQTQLTYGYLNYTCYQKLIFPKYKETLDILRDEILEFVKDGRMPPDDYSSAAWFQGGIGVGAKTNKIIQEFVDYVTPSSGGRRRKRFKKSRRVKRRKHNTTLKVRNG